MDVTVYFQIGTLCELSQGGKRPNIQDENISDKLYVNMFIDYVCIQVLSIGSTCVCSQFQQYSFQVIFSVYLLVCINIVQLCCLAVNTELMIT